MHDVARRAVWVGLAVFAASLLGILTRLPGTLAVFWPANALFLGILLRNPRSSTAATWTFAALGYCAADAVTGTHAVTNIVLNLCNLAGVAAGFIVFRAIGRSGPWLTRTTSLARLAAVVVAASASAAVAGGIATVWLSEATWLEGVARWFSGEFLNYMSVMPAVLTAPTIARISAVSKGELADTARRAFPAAALLVGCLSLIWFVGGAGSIAFAMPALVVVALTTDVFVTSLFILTSTVWTLILTADGHLGLPNFNSMPVTLSANVGLSFLAVAPIAIACVTRERRMALSALRHAVAHDDLTGALRRDEFFRRVDSAMRTPGMAGRPMSVLMMDLDHFKVLNDTYGHSAGDAALVTFAVDVRRHLSGKQIFARLGGEEFAAFLPDSTEVEAVAIAESIRLGQQQRATGLGSGRGATVSIGSASGIGGFETLLDAADRALYDAKRLDRNRTVAVTLA